MKYLVVLLSLFISTAIAAQGAEIDSTITYENESGKSSVTINVKGGTEDLAIVVEGLITTGSVEIELVDPDGQRQAGFQLNTSSDDYVVVRSGDHDDRNAQAKSKSKTKTKSKSKSSTSTSSSNSNSQDGEETLISIRSGGKTTEISSGEGSMSVSSGNGSVSISSNDGVSKVVTKGLGENDTQAKGVMIETIGNPGAGEWKLKIKAEKVTGEIKLQIDQN